MPNTMQEGIFFDRGMVPGRFFLILFLGTEAGVDASPVKHCLEYLWQMWMGLKAGDIVDLPGHPVPPGDLTVTVGYGPLAFELPGSEALPGELGPSNRFLSPRASGGGLLLNGSGLSYDQRVAKNTATEAVMVQFTANTQLATLRALVETWKALSEYERVTGHPPPLYLAGHYEGFQRDDHRSWIDFHDGVSNLRSGVEREAAITIKQGPYKGGTYLCFLRLPVELALWNSLSRDRQQAIVGRDKLTGCALTGGDTSGVPVPESGCPFMGSMEVTDPGNEEFREPPFTGHAGLLSSHVQRANLRHSQNFADPQSLRIFRQGYEFLEGAIGMPPFRVGLNFVSCQDSPGRVIRLLTRDGWLGNTNFGGAARGEHGAVELLTVVAAGIYLIPPRSATSQLPGGTIFH